MINALQNMQKFLFVAGEDEKVGKQIDQLDPFNVEWLVYFVTGGNCLKIFMKFPVSVKISRFQHHWRLMIPAKVIQGRCMKE